MWQDLEPVGRRVSGRQWLWLTLVMFLTGVIVWHSQAAREVPLSVGRKDASDTGISLKSLPPQAQLAVTDPLRQLDLSPAKARMVNAATPFGGNGVSPAPAFLYADGLPDKARALDCLATAAYYEAGDDRPGQQAVVQVVLNRLRHPFFPKSVCGVVFQGSERRTGCQFSFTCDGSMSRRRPSEAAWARARLVASDALAGAVYYPVGLATHFHTNWVVPYWSGSMDKIAQVGTHLFFRWRGQAGAPSVFAAAIGSAEPINAPLAALHHAAEDDSASAASRLSSVAPLLSQTPAPTRQTAQVDDKHLLSLDPSATPESYALGALKFCRGMAKCHVYGYVGVAPSDGKWASAGQADFYYDGGSSGKNLAYWNCQKFARAARLKCLPGTEHIIPDAVATVELGS
jgi:hypothetical protein